VSRPLPAADERPDAFRPFFEGDVVGIVIVLVIAAVMISFWIWKDRRRSD
jgi:hypothetical protein